MKEEISLRKRVLIPLAIALAVLTGAFVVNVHREQDRRLAEDVGLRLESVSEYLDRQLESEIDELSAMISLISRNHHIRQAWIRRDRQELLRLSVPLLNDLSNRLRFTHFYYHDARRINFLRVYNPGRFGDTISRQSLLKAEKTGEPAAGIEIGKLGTLTLRAVHPWVIDNELAGYIEMGEEVGHIIDKLRDILNVELYVSIYKEYLNRKDWESGMELMGRKSDWEQFPDSVVVSKTTSEAPAELGSFLARGRHGYMEMARNLRLNVAHKTYRVGVIPLFDVSDTEVGDLVVLYDDTKLVEESTRTVLVTTLLGLVTGIGLFVIFARILGEVETELISHRRHLEKLVRERSEALIRSNEQLRTEIVERRRAEKGLQLARDQLEQRVAERTDELAETYKQLRREVVEKNQLLEESVVAEERARLARDLHDSLTQSLYSVTLFAQSARHLADEGAPDQLQGCLADLIDTVGNIHKEMRLLIYNLRPSVLDKEGLLGALQQRLDTVENRSGIRGELVVEGEEALTHTIEEAVYRIIQEALNNVLKYAAASLVSVGIRFGENDLAFEVADNGIGFNPQDPETAGGLGFSIMRERIERIKGKLTIDSRPGRGTVVKGRVDDLRGG